MGDELAPVVRQCSATARSGDRCRRSAIPGGTVCHYHGGASPKVREAAVRRLERARLEGQVRAMLDELDEPPADHPIEALLDVMDRSAAMVLLLGAMVGELSIDRGDPAQGEGGASTLYGPDHLGDARAHVLLQLYGEWLDRKARVARLAVDANVEQRRMELGEQQAERIYGFIALAVLDVGLPPVIVESFRRAMVFRLRGEEPPADLVRVDHVLEGEVLEVLGSMPAEAVMYDEPVAAPPARPVMEVGVAADQELAAPAAGLERDDVPPAGPTADDVRAAEVAEAKARAAARSRAHDWRQVGF